MRTLFWFAWLAAAAPAADTSELRGVLTGHDGKPMRHVAVLAGGAAAGPDAKGEFRLAFEEKGLVRVRFTGVHHATEEILLWVEKPERIAVRVQLARPAYSTDYRKLTLSADNAGSPIRRKALAPQADGTYAFETETKLEKLRYAVSGATVAGVSIPGTGAAEFERVGPVWYAVARPVNGKVRIVFDPRLLEPSGAPAKIEFGKKDSVSARLTEVYREMALRMRARSVARKAALEKDGRYQPPAPDASLAAALESRAAGERHPMVRQALLVSWLELLSEGDTEPAQKEKIARVLTELTPRSPFWEIAPDIAPNAAQASGRLAAFEEYLTTMAGKRLDPLVTVFTVAQENGEKEMAKRLLDRIRAEHPEESVTKMLVSFYGEERKIMPGQPAPAFEAPSLGDPAVKYTHANIGAKAYLIDFWATWCPPCIAEMPNLHRAHGKYASKGFQILSVSVDTEGDVVPRFRRERQPMPWLHSIDPELRGMDSPMAKDFDVKGIPRAVLVGPDGTVIAADDDLKGERLERTLERILK